METLKVRFFASRIRFHASEFSRSSAVDVNKSVGL